MVTSAIMRFRRHRDSPWTVVQDIHERIEPIRLTSFLCERLAAADAPRYDSLPERIDNDPASDVQSHRAVCPHPFEFARGCEPAQEYIAMTALPR